MYLIRERPDSFNPRLRVGGDLRDAFISVKVRVSIHASV